MQYLRIMWYVHFERRTHYMIDFKVMFPVDGNISIVRIKSCSTLQMKTELLPMKLPIFEIY